MALSVLCKGIQGCKVPANGRAWTSLNQAGILHDARLAGGNHHAPPGCFHIHMLHNAACTTSRHRPSPMYALAGGKAMYAV